MKKVSVSILTKDDKYKNIERLNNSNCDFIHLDIMDGKFVENKFISLKELPKVLEKIKKPIDVHLMVNDPTKYIEVLSSYKIAYITIHYEIKDVLKYIDQIKALGFKVGLAINPSTKIEDIYSYLDKINLVLIMSVNPGYSGQNFKKYCGLKIPQLKEEIKNRKLNVKIEVDGGIKEEVLEYITNTDIIVSASYVLSDLNNIDKLR